MKLNISGCRAYCERKGIRNYKELSDVLELSVLGRNKIIHREFKIREYPRSAKNVGKALVGEGFVYSH